MRRATYDPTGGSLPSAVKWLLIANGVVFALQLLLSGALYELTGLRFVDLFGLRPAWVIERGWVWQVLTYMFLHGGFFHLLFNMFVLWMFGTEIEWLWGRRGFARYYILCGLGAAALSFVFNYGSVVIGASGAVLGVLLAFGMLFPNQYVYIWFLLPIKAKYLVAGLAVLEIVYLFSQPGGGPNARPEPADQILMAPRGDRAIAQVGDNVYLVTVPMVGGEGLQVSVLRPDNAPVPVKRITKVGGDFLGHASCQLALLRSRGELAHPNRRLAASLDDLVREPLQPLAVARVERQRGQPI